MMHRVAVIIACYNAEETIRRAIQSILDQSYRDFTLYIVDDASTDNSLNLVKQFTDKRIKVIQLLNNSGPAVARNSALFCAEEDYIAILDADDYSFPDRLQVQVKYLAEHPSISLVGGLTEKTILSTNTSVIEPRMYSVSAIKWNQLFRNSFSNSTVMFRREVAIEYDGFDESLDQSEDYALFSRIVRDKNTSNIPKVFSHYSTGDQGISRKYPDRLKRCACSIVKENVFSLISITISDSAAMFLQGVRQEYSTDTLLEGISIHQQCWISFLQSRSLSFLEKKELSTILLRDASLKIHMCLQMKHAIITQLTKNLLKLGFYFLFSHSLLKLIIPERLKKLYGYLKHGSYQNG